jgi:hypothetical protein
MIVLQPMDIGTKLPHTTLVTTWIRRIFGTISSKMA